MRLSYGFDRNKNIIIIIINYLMTFHWAPEIIYNKWQIKNNLSWVVRSTNFLNFPTKTVNTKVTLSVFLLPFHLNRWNEPDEFWHDCLHLEEGGTFHPAKDTDRTRYTKA